MIPTSDTLNILSQPLKLFDYSSIQLNPLYLFLKSTRQI